MPKRSNHTEDIRRFILENLSDHPGDIARVAAEHFDTSRQAMAKHLRALVELGLIDATGRTKDRKYQLKLLQENNERLDVTAQLAEDVVWRDHILPYLPDVSPNVADICQYGFTEMLNNVIEHSESPVVDVNISRNAVEIILRVRDYGVGIFHKIQTEYNLVDPRHALLELSKGKLSTDQESHSGEGIFFTSRMFDTFNILSGSLFFGRTNAWDGEWLIEVDDHVPWDGTGITMRIHPHATRQTQEVFNGYTDELEFGFTRTHVPIKLAKYGDEQLVSRSQAKRVLARFDLFNEVLMDFAGVETIGHSFADEIFRVYQNQHADILLIPVRTTTAIDQTIQRVKAK